MADSFLDVQIDAGIATVSLNRPEKRNALNLDFWYSFPEIIRDIDNNSRARVIILKAQGSVFSAGMDLSIFMNCGNKLIQGEPGRRSENLRRTVKQLQAAINVLEECRIPVLGAIQGGCIGGAFNLVSACDCLYATNDAYFSLKETQLGMTADLGALQRLPYKMPEALVRELAFTGRKFPASEALQAGLLNAVVQDKQQLMTHVHQIAKQIAANSPLAVTGSKEMLNYARDHSVIDSLNYMATWQSGMFQPGEMMKAFQANSNNQPADYDELWPVEPPLS